MVVSSVEVLVLETGIIRTPSNVSMLRRAHRSWSIRSVSFCLSSDQWYQGTAAIFCILWREMKWWCLYIYDGATPVDHSFTYPKPECTCIYSAYRSFPEHAYTIICTRIFSKVTRRHNSYLPAWVKTTRIGVQLRQQHNKQNARYAKTQGLNARQPLRRITHITLIWSP